MPARRADSSWSIFPFCHLLTIKRLDTVNTAVRDFVGNMNSTDHDAFALPGCFCSVRHSIV